MKVVNNPKLSVVTINLNNSKGLSKTIQSVVAQNFPGIEYIIIDGGSTDGSVEVIKDHEQHLTYWLSEKDTGIYNAMNKGLAKSSGEYLLFLNSGDWLHHSDVIESAFRLIDPKASVCAADIYWDENGSLKKYESPESINFESFYIGSISHQATFIKRSMFEKYGYYNESNRIASDWEFYFLILIMNSETYQKLPISTTVFDVTGISNQQSMKELIDKERTAAIQRLVPKLVLEEIVLLKRQLENFKRVERKLKERRYQLIEEIEKNGLLRRILTIQMYVLSKIARFFSKF